MLLHTRNSFIVCVSLLFCLILAPKAEAVTDGINDSFTPWQGAEWGIRDVGWLYTPTVSYDLEKIETKYGSDPGNSASPTITLQFYDALPSQGGQLLVSDDFIRTTNTFSGITFSPILLSAGHTYFVGFHGVFNEPVNVTDDPQSEKLPTFYFDTDGSASYSIEANAGNSQGVDFPFRPILLFNGPRVNETPEPGILAFVVGVGMAFITVFRSTSRRYIKRRSERQLWPTLFSSALLALSCLSFIGLSVTSTADEISQLRTVGLRPTDFTTTFNFAQFDPSLGTLQSIAINLMGTSIADTTVTSVSSPGIYTFSDAASIDLQRPNGTVLADLLFSHSVSGNLGRTDDPPLPFSFRNTAPANPGGAPATTGPLVFTSGTDLALFTGNGSLPLPLTVQGLSGVTGPGAVDATITTYVASSATLTYTYVPSGTASTPEPGTLGLLVGASITAGSLFRQRRKYRRHVGVNDSTLQAYPTDVDSVVRTAWGS